MAYKECTINRFDSDQGSNISTALGLPSATITFDVYELNGGFEEESPETSADGTLIPNSAYRDTLSVKVMPKTESEADDFYAFIRGLKGHYAYFSVSGGYTKAAMANNRQYPFELSNLSFESGRNQVISFDLKKRYLS
jgi:hypothetical protein